MKIAFTSYLIAIMQIFFCTTLLAQEEVEFTSNTSQNISKSELKTKALAVPLNDIKASLAVKSGKPALDRYIDLYIHENKAIRTRNTKALIAKKLEAQKKDLLYPVMYKALGYENWNQIISIPPELSGLRFSKQHEALNLELLTRLHDAWALLDSTLFRIEYGQDKWVEPLIQKNLTLSAIHSWYRGSFNEEYIAELDKLNVDTETTLKSIEKTRSNLDKKAWNNAQIELLKLKSDAAELTQFYFLGVSDVFLNTGLPNLPKDDVFQVLNFDAKAKCLAQAQAMKMGLELLVRRFPEEMRLIKNSQIDDPGSNWQISKIAHELSKIALLFSHKEQAQFAVYALTDIVLDRILTLNQARLNKFLSNTDSFFQDKGPVLRFRGINVLQASLHEIFELTLLDYLLAGERASFTNLMMHRKCILSKPNTGVPASFASILNNQYTNNLDVERFTVFRKGRIKQHALLSSVEHKSLTQEVMNKATLDIQPKEHVLPKSKVVENPDIVKLTVSSTSAPSGAVTKGNIEPSSLARVSDEKDAVIPSHSSEAGFNAQYEDYALFASTIILDSLDAVELAINTNSVSLGAEVKEKAKNEEVVAFDDNNVFQDNRNEAEYNIQPKKHAQFKNTIVLENSDEVTSVANTHSISHEALRKESSKSDNEAIAFGKEAVITRNNVDKAVPNVQSKEHVFMKVDVLEALDSLKLATTTNPAPVEIIAKESVEASSVAIASVEKSTTADNNIKNIDNIRDADFLTAESILEKRNIQLLSEESIKEVFKGRGYTMQVVSTTSPNDVEYLVRRYKKRHDDVFVYLSKVTVEGERISIFKILVGSHKAEDVSRAEYLQLLDTAKKRKAFLKPYSFVRADVAKTS